MRMKTTNNTMTEMLRSGAFRVSPEGGRIDSIGLINCSAGVEVVIKKLYSHQYIADSPVRADFPGIGRRVFFHMIGQKITNTVRKFYFRKLISTAQSSKIKVYLMRYDKVTVIAPATLSNIGAGFDIFGLALGEPYDIIEAQRTVRKGVLITSISGSDSKHITPDPMRNSAGIAAMEVLKAGRADFGIELVIRKGIRPGSGIGSSGASAAGGAFAANLLLEKPLPAEKLVICAARAEEVTSGGFHADNVAPAILGGFTIITSYDPFEVERVDPPADLGIAIAMPEVFISTREARKVIPEKVELKKLVYHVGHASGLVLGMVKGDIGLIGRNVRDSVIEPSRAHLIPYLREVESAAQEAGACAAFLSGSGPSIAAMFDVQKVNGGSIANAMKKVYETNGIRCDTWVTRPGSGCRRIE
ncbi:MAG: homoserine kinase [Methanomassiliicoccales archaeon]|jgi:homoserine kinase|nr:homoserine kinase [Methanomassiliicoccales archaeon]